MSTSAARRTALISVSDKTGLTELALALTAAGWRILSTGGTARALGQAGIALTEVSEHTGFPEIMDGRVKTLHPLIHGGILGRRELDRDCMAEHGIEAIDLVIVNLYPFSASVARPDCTRSAAIEQIDIGGPALLRAAAKNHAHVAVLCDPADYPELIETLPEGPGLSLRARWAARAFAHTAAYDAQISSYLSTPAKPAALPATLSLTLHRDRVLRYGENPHQNAAIYRTHGAFSAGLALTRPAQGKPLSYNNLLDADAAWRGVQALGKTPACIIVKHGNPCGAALAQEPNLAYQAALACDPTAAFGGIIACNRPVDADLADALAERFYEVLIAPELSSEAAERLGRRKNLRILCPQQSCPPELDFKAIDGGWLVQQVDRIGMGLEDRRVVTRRRPDDDEWADLEFAWRVVGLVRSNAIVYAHQQATLGIGAGQMSRIDAARFAVLKAQDQELNLAGAAMASDAFFPFADSIEIAATNGIRSIIQPGGSVRDQEVIAACDAHDIAMVLTGQRHFRH